jgi:hypothetical protein
VLLFTAAVVIVTVTLLEPAGMVTAGSVTSVALVLLSVTTAPPVGAGPLSEIVREADVPPTTLVGLNVRLTSVAAVIVSVADLVTPLHVALIVGFDVVDTALVLMVNVAVFAPAATVTLLATAAGLPALSVTVMPPTGAGPLMVTVPVDELPPSTLAGLNVRPVGLGASTVTVADTDLPFAVAVIVAGVFADTGTPVTVNDTAVAPADRVTVPGTVTGPLLLRATVMPPAGADVLMVSLAVAVPPGVMLGGVVNANTVGMGPFTVSVPDAETLLAVAVMVAVVLVATPTVVALNVTDVLPAATVTLVGIETEAPLVLLRLTASPPLGAAVVILTVPVDETPPVTLDGLNVTPVGVRAVAVTVSVADAELPLADAVMLGVAVVLVALVVAVNVAVLLPCATVTLLGTVAPAVLLRLTGKPPSGAAPLIVTVPVEEPPPVTLIGFNVTLDAAGALTVSVAVVELPFADPVMVTLVFADTGMVVAVNVAEVLPAATVTLDGTVVLGSLLLRFTGSPPVGAAPLMVTVPVEEVPPVTPVGLNVTFVGTGAVVCGVSKKMPLISAVLPGSTTIA